jgi:hypothetical protein
MYQNDWMLSQLAEERRRDFMRQAEADRLIRQAELVNPPHRHTVYHVLDWVGRHMVHWGERLQARHVLSHQQALTHTTGG